MLPIIGDIITAASGLFGKVIDKVAGDKMDEATKEKLKVNLTLELTKMDMNAFEKQIDDQVDARALAKVEADRAPWLIRMFNGLVRPCGGMGALLVFFYTVIYRHLGKFFKVDLEPLNLVDWQYIILLSIIGFFFGLRELSKDRGTQARI